MTNFVHKCINRNAVASEEWYSLRLDSTGARVCKGQRQMLIISRDRYQALAWVLNSVMCSAIPNLTAETVFDSRAGAHVCKG